MFRASRSMRVFLELPKMQCACVTLAEKFRGRLNLLCTFPGGHWIIAVIVKWFAFLNKRPQRGRGGHCGNEVGTLRRDIEIWLDSQPVITYIGSQPQ